MSLKYSPLVIVFIFLSNAVFAEKPSVLFKGSLYSNNPKGTQWQPTNKSCSIRISNAVKKKHPKFNDERVYLDVAYEGGKKVLMTVDYTIRTQPQTYKPDTEYFTGQISDGFFNSSPIQLNLLVEPDSVENYLALSIKPKEVLIDKGTFTGGYFGGNSYAWYYKCMDLQGE